MIQGIKWNPTAMVSGMCAFVLFLQGKIFRYYCFLSVLPIQHQLARKNRMQYIGSFRDMPKVSVNLTVIKRFTNKGSQWLCHSLHYFGMGAKSLELHQNCSELPSYWLPQTLFVQIWKLVHLAWTWRRLPTSICTGYLCLRSPSASRHEVTRSYQVGSCFYSAPNMVHINPNNSDMSTQQFEKYYSK